MQRDTNTTPQSESDTALREAPPSLWLLLLVWLALSVQSFGGGVATLTLIRRNVVEQRRWISDEEFARDWALCQIAPGINLLALTILIGRRIAGLRGILVSLVGLLLPTVTLTVLITAFYARIQRLETVQAALRGMIPASVGLGLVTAWRTAQPLLKTSRREGRASLAFSLLVLVGSGLGMAVVHAPVVLILLAAGLVLALAHAGRARFFPVEEEPDA
jgi:chromate transporter